MDDDYLTDGSSALDPDYNDSHYTSGSDPNKEVLQSAKDDIRPKLQVIEGGGQGNSEDDNSDSTNKPNLTVINGGKLSPAKVLGSAEKNASQLPLGNVDSDSNDTKADARTNESIGNNGFINNTTGKLTNSKETRKGFLKGRGNFKKRAPLILLALLLGGGGIGIYSSQAILPFALVNRIKQEFNSQHVSLNRRYKYIFNRQLRTNLNKKNTSFLGHLRLTKKQKKFLKKQNIEVKEVEAGGSKHNILIVHNDDGTSKIVTGNSKKFNAALEKKMSGSDAPKFIKELKLSDTKPVKFKEALKTDENFTNRFNLGSKPVAGHVSGWFDSIFNSIRQRIDVTRNRWLNFDRRDDENTRIKKYETIGSVSDEKRQRHNYFEGDSPEDGDDEDVKNRRQDVEAEIDSAKSSSPDTSSIKATADSIKAKAEVAGKVTGGGELLCSIYAALGTINAIKYGLELMQVLDYTSGFTEAVQKTQVGEGDHSAMAEYLNHLGQKDSNGLSGLSAEGIGYLISGTHVDTDYAYASKFKNDPLKERSRLQAQSAIKFNVEDEKIMRKIVGNDTIRGILDKLGINSKYSVKKMIGCGYVGILDGVVDAAGLIASLVTGGATGAMVIGKKVAQSVGLSTAITLMAELLIPKVAEWFIRSFASDIVGPDLGNALASGAEIYLSKNHQGAGGSPGDQEAVFAYKREQTRVLAEEARAERSIKSPFDTSTNSTFLGSITYTILPLAISTTSISNTVTNLSNIVANSTLKLLPSASAAAETQLITQAGKCPSQEDVGIMSSGYCNPYYTSDLDTTEMAPEMLTYGIYKADTHNFQTRKVGEDQHIEIEYDQYGNPILNQDIKKSTLMRYAKFCGQRDSVFGTVDANITSMVSGKFDTGVSLFDAAVNSTPIIGDAKTIYETAMQQANAKWISGEICVNSKKNKRWTEMQLYQRYLEDQRLYENMDVIEQSSGQQMIARYNEEHANEESISLLARFTGLTDQTIADTFDLVDYYNFVANYDPSLLFPVYKNKIIYFVGSLFTKNVIYKNNTPISEISNSPIYIDLRNKNYGI